MVDNEPGVLARVVGLFSGRGYNIESLSVSEVDSDKFLSRVTVVTSGTKIIVDQIDSFIGKELILIKLNVKRITKKSFEDVINKTKANILFDKGNEVILQFSGSPSEIGSLLKKLKPFKVIEQTRSGLVSMALGTKYIKK